MIMTMPAPCLFINYVNQCTFVYTCIYNVHITSGKLQANHEILIVYLMMLKSMKSVYKVHLYYFHDEMIHKTRGSPDPKSLTCTNLYQR
jgi:hypothetical protein